MIFQLFILGLVIMVSPLIPPILVPLSYSMTAALVVQNANLRILSIVSVFGALAADIVIWKMQNFIIPKFTTETKPMKEKTIFGRMVNKLNEYFKKEEKIGKLSLKRERYLEKREGRIMTFLFAIFCYLPVIPDIISTRLLYKKIKFPYFIIAVIIGKSLTHVPFIFVGKSIFQLLNIHF